MLKPKKKLQVELLEQNKYLKMKLPTHKISKILEQRLNQKIVKSYVRPKISLATEDDLPKITRIYNRAWLSSATPFRKMTVEQFRLLYFSPSYKFLLARVFGKVAGFLILSFEGKNEEYGLLVGLAIDLQFQRKAIGTALAIRAWQMFKMRNIKEIRCEIYHANSRSLNFAQSVGFEQYDIIMNMLESIKK